MMVQEHYGSDRMLFEIEERRENIPSMLEKQQYCSDRMTFEIGEQRPDVV